MKLEIRESCWSKDTWKSRPKWKPFSCSYPQRMTFWSEKAWRKTQILLGKYASLTWQSTAWRDDQMLTPESFALQLLLPAMFRQQILLCHLRIPFSQTFYIPYFSYTWCWAFVVTLRAAEWITSSLGSLMCLQMAWCWTLFVSGSSWMVYYWCGFFRVSLNGLILNICCHTRSNWIIYSCCGFFHVP